MVNGSHVASGRSASESPSERPAGGAFSRLRVFIFGVMPSDEAWRAPVFVWVVLGISAVLLFVSHAIRHWGWRLNGFDSAALATAASVGSTVLLALGTLGLALVRARRLMTPPRERDDAG